jgi:hypothetical protein
MSIATLRVAPPVLHRQAFAPRDHGARDLAIESFEAGRHRDAVGQTLRYLLPDANVPDAAEQPFHFVQGSARIRLRLGADSLHVTAALAALKPEAQATAALRFFLTRISGTGKLYQPRLRDGVIALEFDERLALLHPLKLIEVLTKLPTEADRNDAWMVEQFGVATPDREPIEPLDAAEFARAWTIWSEHWAAVEALVAHSRRRRSLRFLSALGAFAVHQVRYALPLFGAVRARLGEDAEGFGDDDEDPNKREAALVKCIKTMQRVGAEDLRACLGRVTYAINPLRDGSPSLLTSLLANGERMQAVDELRAAGHAMEAALELFALYLYLLARHSWSTEVEAALRNGLDLASGKPWHDAAAALAEHAHATVRGFGSHGAHEQDDDET